MGMHCELCDGRAAVYCCADEAYVCWECDAKVHGANFLVARHVRSVLCHRCHAPTPTLATSCTFTATAMCPTCACSPELESFSAGDDQSAASVVPSEQSGTTTTDEGSNVEEVSSTMIIRSKKRRSRSPSPDSVIPESRKCSRQEHAVDHNKEGTEEEKLEHILRQWNRQLGPLTSPRTTDHVVSLAIQLLRKLAGSIKSHQVARLDARAALAACLWMALKLDWSSSASELPRVDKFERCTGIPADVVLNVEAKLCRLCTNLTSSSVRLNLDLTL